MLVALAVAGAAPMGARAAVVLDQASTPAGTTRITSLTGSGFNAQSPGLLQSFTVGQAGTLARLGWAFNNLGGTEVGAALAFYTADPLGLNNRLTGAPAWTQAITLGNHRFVGNANYNWATLPSWDVSASGIAVTAGQKLWFSITPAAGAFVTEAIRVNGAGFGYAAGERWSVADPFGNGRLEGVASSFDTGFQVFLDTPAAAPGTVPEPASWAMMLAGFFGLGAALRRRRAGAAAAA